MLTHARLLHETLGFLEHLNVDIDTDHLESAVIPRSTLDEELESLAESFTARAEFLAHLFGVSKDSFSGYMDKDYALYRRWCTECLA